MKQKKLPPIFIEPQLTSYYERFPINLVDVGASGGLNNNWKPASRHLHVIGFEPDEKSYQKLQENNSKTESYFNVGLYNKKTTIDFFVTRKQACSSIYRPNRSFLDQFPQPERFDIQKELQIQTDTLDNVLQASAVTDIDFIKVDTQGSELCILEGAKKTLLKSVFGLELEVEFAEMYSNQALFSHVDLFMRECGFQLFDLRLSYFKRSVGIEYGKPKGQLTYGDALYLRGIESLEPMIHAISDPLQKKAKLIKAISICFLYGYFDYAFQLLTQFSSFFAPEEIGAIEAVITKNIHCRKKIPHFPGRQKMANLFYKLWDVFETKPTRSSAGMSGVGNL